MRSFQSRAGGLPSLTASCLLTVLAAVLAAPGWALAQPTEVLPPTVVVGRQIEEKLSAELAEYGHQVVVIQGEEMMRQGYTDLNEALAKMAPSLVILNKGRGDYNTFWLNGNRKVLWLMDGVRLNNRLYGGAYVDTIGIHLVERVEILAGGEGLFYGTESANGVVNIITKKPAEGFSGEIGAAVGTKGYYDAHATFAAGTARHRFLFSAAYDTWEGYRAFDTRAYELNDNFDPVKRGYDRLNLALKYETELDLEGYNRLGVTLMRNEGSFDFANPESHLRVNNRVENVGILKWDHDVTPNWSYYVKAYYHSWWTKYDVQLKDYTMALDKALWGYQDWGINVMTSLRTDSGHELLLGYDYQNYWARDDVWRILPMHEQVHALFFQFRPRFAFWEEWNLAIGARYNRTDGGDSFIWNVSSKMPILDGDRLFVRANIGTSFILPTAEELFLYEPPDLGNPDLKPQRSFSATLGLASVTEAYDFDIGVFYERITDMVIWDTGLAQNSPGKTEIGGFTVSGAVRPLEGLSLTASFVRQGARVTNPEGLKTSKLANQPKEYLKLGAQYDGELGNGQKFGVGVFATWMGRIYSDQNRYLPDERWQNFGNFWLTDVNLYYRPVESVRVTLSLANVFDTKYGSNGLYFKSDSTAPKGYRLFESPLGSPFSATLGVTYSF